MQMHMFKEDSGTTWVPKHEPEPNLNSMSNPNFTFGRILPFRFRFGPTQVPPQD